MQFVSEYTHHLLVRVPVSDLPCDPNDLNAWSSVLYRLEKETHTVIFEDMSHYGTSPERDYAPSDVADLSFTFSVYNSRHPAEEIERNIAKVYAVLKELGFRMPNIGGPFQVEFVDQGGRPIDVDLVPMLDKDKLPSLLKRDRAQEIIEIVKGVPWYQDVFGSLYISPSALTDYDAQLLIASGQDVDSRTFQERRITVSPIQLHRQRFSDETGFFVSGSYTAGTTPADVIYAAFGNSPYTIDIKGDDAQAMVDVVNQGIDSYLEAICDSTFNGGPQHLVCSISRKDILVVLRRLWEMAENGNDSAGDLRSSILETLGIEEI